MHIHFFITENVKSIFFIVSQFSPILIKICNRTKRTKNRIYQMEK